MFDATTLPPNPVRSPFPIVACCLRCHNPMHQVAVQGGLHGTLVNGSLIFCRTEGCGLRVEIERRRIAHE